MEENTNNTQQNASGYNDLEKNLDKVETTVTGFMNDANKVNGEIQGFSSLDKEMEESIKKVDELKLKQYIADKELPAETTLENLTEEQKAELEAIELPEDVLLPLALDVEDNMFTKVYKNRYHYLTEMIGNQQDSSKIGKIDQDLQLLNHEMEERNNKLAELEAKLATVPQFIEGEDGKQEPNPEYDEIQKEIDGVKDEQTRIQNLIDRADEVRKKCVDAMGLQKEIKANMRNALVATFGEKVADRVMEIRKQERDGQNKGDNQTPNNPAQEQQEQQQEQAQQTQQQAPQQAAPAGGEVVAEDAPAQEEAEIEPDLTEQYFKQLGISEEAELTPELALGLLKKYTSKDIPDDLKYKMFQDADVKDKIQEAINIASNHKKRHPFYRFGFRGVRKNLTTLMDSTFPKKVLEECGIMDIDEDAIVAMERAKNSIQAQLDGPNLTAEEREELKEQMEKLNDVSEFRSSNEDVKLMLRRVTDRVKYFAKEHVFDRDAYKKQLPPAMEVSEEPEVEPEERTNNWSDLAKDEEEITQTDVTIEENVKEKTQEEIEQEKKAKEVEETSIE